MVKEEKFIKLSSGPLLKAQILENNSEIWILSVHGIGEHAGRHQHLIKLFSQNFNILQFDLRGHGESEGKRGDVEQFSQYIEDLWEIIQFLKQSYSMKRFFLYGHSMGGTIVSGFIQKLASKTNNLDLYPEKIFLSSPAVGIPGISGHILKYFPKISSTLSSIPYGVPLPKVIPLEKLSHDARIIDQYLEDPLTMKTLNSHLLFQLISASNNIFQRPLRAQCPLKVLIGSKDSIVSVPMLVDYFTGAEKNAQLSIIEGGLHELHHEIKRFQTPFFKELKAFFLQGQDAML